MANEQSEASGTKLSYISSTGIPVRDTVHVLSGANLNLSQGLVLVPAAPSTTPILDTLFLSPQGAISPWTISRVFEYERLLASLGNRIFEYRMQETAGVQAIDVINRHAGTYTGPGWVYAGVAGPSDAGSFATTGQGLAGAEYITTPHTADFHLTNYTAIAWVQCVAGPGVGLDYRLMCQQEGGGSFQAIMLLNGVAGAAIFDSVAGIIADGVGHFDGLWHMVGAVRDIVNHTLTLYVDGLPVATAASPSVAALNIADVYTIGAQVTGGVVANPTSGNMAFASLNGSAATDAQMAALYAAMTAIANPNLQVVSSFFPTINFGAAAQFNLPGLPLAGGYEGSIEILGDNAMPCTVLSRGRGMLTP